MIPGLQRVASRRTAPGKRIKVVSMPTVSIDGIATRYEVEGSGPPMLMFSPGGFDGRLEQWTAKGIYAQVHLMEHLMPRYTCIVFDRRECGASGGRVERIAWADYAKQGFGLLDHLKIERAHFLGGCLGVSPVIAAAVLAPARVQSMILYWPVGGARYRLSAQQRFAEHLAFVQQHGLQAVVDAAKEGKQFGRDPRGGPWASVLQHDRAFAENFVQQDIERYKLIVAGMARRLYDRDTAPGAEPEDLLRLNIPALVIAGHDKTHATSAARYLEECIPNADYWFMPRSEQTPENAPARVLAFLAGVGE
jgi:pimeloyl-ACP methyl ester carboxylesterase